jgi:hypothetical protein
MLKPKVIKCLARDIDKLEIPKGEMVEIKIMDKIKPFFHTQKEDSEGVEIAPEQYWENEIYYSNK